MDRSAARGRPRLACLVLAAGASRRLGRPKQLLRLRGRPLLIRAVEAAAAASGAAPHVVVGAQALRMRAVLRRAPLAATAVMNPRWHTGIASSLQAGLAALPRHAAAVLVVLVDQPAVGTRALAALVRAWRRRPGVPAAAEYSSRIGVPAILPRALWRDAARLSGDAGARQLLRAAARVTRVPIPEAALDVDEPADAERLARGPCAWRS